MSKKTILVAAGVLLAAGAVAAMAHGGRGGGWRMGGGDMGSDGMRGERGGGHEGRGHRMGGKGGFGRHGAGLTEEEWSARTRERFARLDANSDGVIEAAEVSASMKQGGERRAERGQKFAGRMLKRMGGDKDGKLTRAAFDAFIEKQFAEADLNSDGKVDDADLPPMMRGRQALAQEGGGRGFGGRGRGGEHGGRMLGFLRNADANRDGAITREEVKAAADKRFANFDRSGDGSVDQADFDKLRSDTADYRVQRFMHRYGAKDGKVTRAQYEAKSKEQFAMHDADGDGRMDGRGGMRGGRHGGGRGGPMMQDGAGGPAGGSGPGPHGPGMGGPGGPAGGPGRN